MAEGLGVISEHEPIAGSDSEGAAKSYNPSDEERRTILMVTKLFERLKRYRRGYDHKWLENYKFFRGKQWRENRPSYRSSEVINFVFQAIQSIVPIMTDTRPKVEFVPKEPSDTELAEILNQVFESDWEMGSWMQELTASIYDAHFYGIGMSSVGYDPEADLGAGAITFESEDPFYCFPDNNATDVNKKSRCFIKAEPVDLDLAKSEYKDKAEFIQADLVDLVGGNRTDIDKVRYQSPVDARTLVEAENQPDSENRSQALKITCYLKSDDVLEEKKSDKSEDTGEVTDAYEVKLKYPNGRRIVICGGVLVEDTENPFEDGKFPFARLVNYILPREYYGISEIENLESPQRIFNKLVSYAIDVLNLMGNPVWVVDNDSEIDTDLLFNRPGLVIEKAKGSEVSRMEGVALQPYVLQLIDKMQAWFEGMAGNRDVTQGVNPTGVTAASAITELQEAAQTRIRLKSRNLDAYLGDIGRLWVSRCFQFYTAPRVFRITGNENAQTYFKFYIEDRPMPPDPENLEAGPTQAKFAVLRPYSQDPATGQHVLGDASEYQIRGEFDVRVSTGSSLPFAKAQKMALATQLFDRHAIDELELLKAADYPNYEAVWARVQQAQAQNAQAQAQLQAQAKGASGPQGGGSPGGISPPPDSL